MTRNARPGKSRTTNKGRTLRTAFGTTKRLRTTPDMEDESAPSGRKRSTGTKAASRTRPLGQTASRTKGMRGAKARSTVAAKKTGARGKAASASAGRGTRAKTAATRRKTTR